MRLQEETQQMAMGGEDAAESLQALKDLSWLARTHGAKVAVVQTWAWLDGKSSLWPTFESMQVRPTHTSSTQSLSCLAALFGLPQA